MTCEVCGSPSGACAGCCHPADNSRFAEFSPSPIMYRKEPLFSSPEALHAEVNRRLAAMQKEQNPLTERQQEIYDLLLGRAHDGQPMPTNRELCAHFGYRSPNAISGMIRALERKGYLVKHMSGKARDYRLKVNPTREAKALLKRIFDSGVDLDDQLFSDLDAFLQVKP